MDSRWREDTVEGHLLFLFIFWWGSFLEAIGLLLWLIAWSLHLS